MARRRAGRSRPTSPGRMPRALAASVEAHLLRCARCRTALGRLSGDAECDQAWARLADAIDQPSVTPLGRLTGGHWFVRSAVATPAMLQAALAALVTGRTGPARGGDDGRQRRSRGAPPPRAARADGRRRARLPRLGGPRRRDQSRHRVGRSEAGRAARARRVSCRPAVRLPRPARRRHLGRGCADRLGAAWCLPGLALAALVLLAGTTRLDPLQVAIGISAAWAGLGAWPW